MLPGLAILITRSSTAIDIARVVQCQPYIVQNHRLTGPEYNLSVESNKILSQFGVQKEQMLS